MKHAVLLLVSLGLGALGTLVLLADIYHGGQLHLVSASVGTGALVVALALGIPVELKTALDVLLPILPYVGKRNG